MRVTVADIAREAGVSTATVDRVLNRRDGVRAPTRNRVLTAARRLGYTATAPPAPVVLDFVLPGGSNTYMNLLAEALAAASNRTEAVTVRVQRVTGFNPAALAEALGGLLPDSQGVGLVALDHPTVREAVRDLAVARIPFLTMVSDLSNVPRLGYVGIDNRASGRLAGYLLGTLIKSRRSCRKVALLAGSLSYRGHEEREMGFRHLLAEDFPEVSVVELRENLDDFHRSYAETKSLLEAHPDLAGIYNIGAGNRGIAQALGESGRAGEVAFIGHELTEHTRKFLLSRVMDAVIDQQPKLEAREAVTALAGAARRWPVDRAALAVGFQVIFRENLPPR